MQSILTRLGQRRVEYISTAVICVIFAFCFAHLEYYYIKDPALQISNGKVESTYPNADQSRETKPLIGNMYQYHLFPMLFIFILISFAGLFDDLTFKLLGKRKREKAALVGIANLTTAIVVEDFAWFMNRFAAPLINDHMGGRLMQPSDWTSMHIGYISVGAFVVPIWYILAIAISTICYWASLRNQHRVAFRQAP